MWASKSAGSVIRGDELPEWFAARLAERPAVHRARRQANRRWAFLRLFGLAGALRPEHLMDLGRHVCRHVSDQLAEGNLLVFAELAPVLSALGEGREPPRVPGLIRSTAHYRAALQEADPLERAALVLAGNVEAVAHEQHRLQRYIAAAVDAPLREGLHRLIDRHVARRVPAGLARALCRRAIAVVEAEAEHVWQEVVTAWLMRLETADERLCLDEGLRPPPGAASLFPPALSGPAAEAVVHRWDRTGGAGADCGATDWTRLEERMGYIVNLFRSRQQHPTLRRPPFTPPQLDAMAAGLIPAGPL